MDNHIHLYLQRYVASFPAMLISRKADRECAATTDLAALLSDDSSVANMTVRLCTIADYFCVEGVSVMAAKILNENYRLKAKMIQEEESTKFIPDDFITSLFNLAGVVYSRSPFFFEPLRKTLLNFFELTRYIVLRDSRFRAPLRDVPELSHDILMSLVKHEDEDRSMVLFDRPPRCSGCRRELGSGAFYPVTWVERKESVLNRDIDRWEGFGPEGLCEKCARVDEEVPDAFPSCW